MSSPCGGDPPKPSGVRATAFWALEPDGAVRAQNRSATEIGGGPGLAWRDAWPPETHAAVDSAVEAARRGETATFHAQVRWGDCERVKLEVTVSPLTGAGGAISLSAAARDVTLELGTVLANISHEIRTPLNGLVAGVEILGARPLAPSERELAAMVRASALALEARLQRVLELIQLDQGRVTLNPGPFVLKDLLEAAAAAAAPTAHAKGLTLACDSGGLDGARCQGDFTRLRQVLGELLGNAVKFTAVGGVRLGAERVEGGLRFTVEDTGVGLGDWPAPAIFDRFRQVDETATRAHGGFGLGLAFARELLELMGGRIGCAPRPGGGSVFWCDASMAIEVAPAETAVGPCAASRGGQPQILVADDHPTNRRLVELILGDFARVRTVGDGREAIEAFAEQPFDLVLMDLQMPVLDGVSAVSEIRRWEAEHHRPRTPIAMLTANTDPDNVAASRAAGADQHIAKPFTPNLLVSSVQALLHAPAA